MAIFNRTNNINVSLAADNGGSFGGGFDLTARFANELSNTY
jgi:hypothetical protein